MTLNSNGIYPKKLSATAAPSRQKVTFFIASRSIQQGNFFCSVRIGAPGTGPPKAKVTRQEALTTAESILILLANPKVFMRASASQG